MVRNRNIKQKIIMLFGDMIVINLALFFAASIKFQNGIEYHATTYPQFFVAFNFLWLILIWISDGYQIKRSEHISAKIVRIIGLILLHAMLVSTVWVFAKAYYYSREFLLLTYAFLTPLMLLFRVGLALVLRIYRKHGMNYRNIIVYGYGEIATELVAYFRLHSEMGYRFNGYFDDNQNESEVIGGFENIKDYVTNNNIDEIYCCLPYVSYSKIRDLIDFGDESLVRVKLLTDFRGFASKSIELERFDHIPVLNITTTPLEDWKNRAIKRAFDVVFSLFVIIFIFSWLFPILALIIKLESRGPIFFKQQRTGQEKKAFNCYKFRSMRVNDGADAVQAVRNDSRITKFGAFIRKTSIDELPQFFNVLSGDMSVIGPRPHMLKHTEEYSKVVEKFMARHFVKPGITGLAQAKGFRGETIKVSQMKNRVKLDRFYVDNWSFWLDVKILFMTLAIMVSGDDNAF